MYCAVCIRVTFDFATRSDYVDDILKYCSDQQLYFSFKINFSFSFYSVLQNPISNFNPTAQRK